MNYCPLAFIEETGLNRTPDKLPPHERAALFGPCDEHLREVVRILKPDWLIGVGDFAMKRASDALTAPVRDQPKSPSQPRIGQILHPSPACPASNKDWAGTVTAQLCGLGVWK